MKKQRSIAKIYFYSLILISLTIIVLSASLWTNAEFSQFKAESDATRKNYIESQEKLIQSEVNKVITYIEYKKSLAENRLKNGVKSRTYEAYDTAMYIYEQNKNTKDLVEIKQMVHDALFAVSWDNGLGYYFAEDMQGTELVNRNNPDLEGVNIIDVQDSKGNYIMRDILAVANSSQREGFCSYYWNKPENPGVLVPKISYVKYFKPFDWVIGNGKYLVDEQNEIKEEILSRINMLRVGKDGYIFVGTWEGDVLSGPAKGKNMFDVEDSNGVKIVQKLIDVSKSDGGFVRYVMPKFEGQRPVHKISYAVGIHDWQWYVGTGLYVDEIEKVIQQRLENLKKKITLLILRNIVFFSLLIFLSYLLAHFLTKKIKVNLDLFNDFFKKSATTSLKINANDVYFSEFRSLATSANRMVIQRKKTLEEKEILETKLTHAQKMEAIGTLAGGIAHDFNNILTAILGYSELAIMEAKGNKEILENIDQVFLAGHRAKDLVKQILTFSRSITPEKKPLQLSIIVKEVIKLLRSSIPTTIEIKSNIKSEKIVLADPGQIHQVVMNLGTNAYQAMKETGGILHIELTDIEIESQENEIDSNMVPGTYVLLLISDTGVGINKEIIDKIFEPYFTTKNKGEGTGLGLAVVHGIINDHCGSIKVSSEQDHGTKFYVYLPVVHEEVTEPFFDKKTKVLKGGNERIMFVDDEEAICNFAKLALENYGYNVSVYKNGSQAFQDFEKNPLGYDLVISDVTMPYMTGKDLAQNLLEVRPDIPIILCSGHSELLSKEQALAMGVKQFCEKPLAGTDYIEISRKVLDS